MYFAYKRGAHPRLAVFADCIVMQVAGHRMLDFRLIHGSFDFAMCTDLVRRLLRPDSEITKLSLGKVQVEVLPDWLWRVRIRAEEEATVCWRRHAPDELDEGDGADGDDGADDAAEMPADPFEAAFLGLSSGAAPPKEKKQKLEQPRKPREPMKKVLSIVLCRLWWGWGRCGPDDVRVVGEMQPR